jgi:hypothetical protein
MIAIHLIWVPRADAIHALECFPGFSHAGMLRDCLFFGLGLNSQAKERAEDQG